MSDMLDKEMQELESMIDRDRRWGYLKLALVIGTVFLAAYGTIYLTVELNRQLSAVMEK